MGGFDQSLVHGVNGLGAWRFGLYLSKDGPVPSIAAIEIGGTHVSAALVEPASWSVRSPIRRTELDPRAAAETLLGAIADAADGLDAPLWGIAIPDPFDYVGGIGRFRGVGKFESLDGVNVRTELARLLGVTPSTLVFCNDADAFTLGEWAAGAGRGSHRCVGLTLGTGVGSGWVVDGHVVDPGSPAGGRIHRLTADGKPLEESMSRRAIRSAYAGATGDRVADVREIAELARDGDQVARDILQHALSTLGRVVAPAIDAFGADLVIVGGSMANSWDLFEPWFRAGWVDGIGPEIRTALACDEAAVIGAAYAAAFAG
jgi:glucokinase